MPTLSSPALDGGAVHAVRHRGLAALAHVCPPEPYQGSEEEVRGWVAAHNAVVEEAWQSAESVLPMSFDVIVTGDADRSAEANLTCWLAEHYAALSGRLQSLEGRAEVGVQVLWDIENLNVSGVIEAQAPVIPPRGRAYFARQQLQRHFKEELERKSAADCRRYIESLRALADDVQVNKPRPVKGRQMVLNLSLLAARAAISRLGEYLEGVSQEPGVEVRFTGPWPPYSFAGAFGIVENNGREVRWPTGQSEVNGRQGAHGADSKERRREGDAPRAGRDVGPQS